MCINNDHIAKLLTLYCTGELSDEERQELDAWLSESAAHRRLLQELASGQEFSRRYSRYRTLDTTGMSKRFNRLTGCRSKRRRLHLLWSAAAVVLLLGAGLTAFLKLGQADRKDPVLSTPGKTSTTLVLHDGQTLKLTPGDTAAVQLPSFIEMDKQGNCLEYQDDSSGKDLYNTLQVPRGGEYRVTLADGTAVHLNAGSELRYPVAFPDDERKVELKGEAWFEVRKDGKRPFIVQTAHVRVRVYGTAFAVNTCYGQETTVALAEGSVGITAGGTERRMKPEEVAIFSHRNRQLVIEKRDLAPYIAWRNGILAFDAEPLERIMERLAMWYDMEVFFASEKARKETFTGYLKRYDSIDTILKALTETITVRFELKGNTLTIY